MKCPGVHCDGCTDSSGIPIAIGIVVIIGLVLAFLAKHARGIEQFATIFAIAAGGLIGSLAIGGTVYFVRTVRRDHEALFVMPHEDAIAVAQRASKKLPASEKSRAISPAKKTALLGVVINTDATSPLSITAQKDA